MMVKGAVMALEKHPSLAVCLVGSAKLIESECKALGADMSRVEIIDAPEEINNYDSPATALFEKQNSSLVIALKAVAERGDITGLINAGSTGALLAGSMRYLSGKERVRPALAAVLPAENGGFTCIVDTGATIDCGASTLHHFARLGGDFMKRLYKIENPKIGLLSNGAEPTKGNKVVKETHALLADDVSINFVGNVEGTNALSGICDVLVCDGFAGNQVLKITEGTAKRVIKDVVKFAKRTGSEDAMKLTKQLLGMYDIESLGGANLLGVRKPIVKMHGSSNERTVVNSTEMLLNIANNRAVFDAEMFKKGEV